MKGFLGSIGCYLLVLLIAITPVVALSGLVVAAVLLVAIALDLFVALRGYLRRGGDGCRYWTPPR